jgi:excisionase family DNA binding protein
VRYPAAVVDCVRHLAQNLPDGEIADRLNQEGHVSALGKPFTGSMIKWIRYRYQIPKASLLRPKELTVQQVAERLRVSPHVVYYWVDRGVIQARRLNAGSPYWITLNEPDEQKLQDWVRNSCRIRMTSSTRLEEGAL